MPSPSRLALIRSRFAALRKTPGTLAAFVMPAEFAPAPAAPAPSRSVHVWRKSEKDLSEKLPAGFVPDYETLSPRDFVLSPEDEALSALSRAIIRATLPDMGENEFNRPPLALPFGAIGR